MSIFLGSKGFKFSRMYLGSNEISEMYLGSDLIYSSGWPYKTLRFSTDGGITWEDHGRPDSLFSGQFFWRGITHLELPDSLTTIGEWAFSDNEIESLYIPESIKTIGQAAFAYNKLTYVEFPETLESIGGGAFLENPYLAEVRISSRTSYVKYFDEWGAYISFPSHTRIITY